MTNSYLKRNKIYQILFVLFILSLFSVIPILKTYGKLTIGNDTLIPIIPEFSFHNGYEWLEVANGIYASNDYFSWVSIFFVLKNIGLNIYQAGFVFQFLIFFLSGLGIYKIFNLFNNKSRLFGLIPAIAFIYSPYLYDHMTYFYATATSIWLIYFLMKFIKSKKLTLIDVAGISVLAGTLGNLPNPKYHFLVFLAYLITIIISLLIRLISVKDLKANLLYIFLLLLSISHLTLRYLYYGISIIKDSNIVLRATSTQENTMHAFDYGAALISKMIRLWHTPGINPPEQVIMNEPLFITGYYLLPILVLGLFPLLFKTFVNQRRKVYFIFYCLALFFIFLAKSSNPPFGYIYDWFVMSFKIFAFMRSTAGMVIYAAIFYTLIYGVITQFFFYKYPKLKFAVLVISFLIILIPGYHIWTGKYFLNLSPVNPNINKKEHGLKIPEDYFRSAYQLDKLKLDSKLDVVLGARGYQNNSWGYYGFLIYPWFINKPIISFDKLDNKGLTYSLFNNVRYVYYDKTILSDKKDIENIFRKYELVDQAFSSTSIDIFRKFDETFIPHFFISKDIGNNTSLEFKKINPTKYRIRIHESSGKLQLVFLENFDKQWMLYSGNSFDSNFLKNNSYLGYIHNSYKILDSNTEDQATKEELISFIKNGKITTLGNLKSKLKNHYIFVDGREKFSYREKFTIDFISKEFSNTIQNNNLPTGSIFETLFKNPIEKDIKHIMINGFVNGWTIDVDNLCNKDNQIKCIKNTDGSYDFEIIVEFWPQRLTYIGFTISFIVIGFCLLKTAIDKYNFFRVTL